MSEKTFNPTTGKYDYMLTRNTGGYQMSPVASSSLYYPYSSAKEDKVSGIKEDLRDIKFFDDDIQNSELITKSGYNDVLGITAYTYKHKLETQDKYKQLLLKYPEEELINAGNFQEKQPWNEKIEKPKLLENLTDDEIDSLSSNYLSKANKYYEEVTKPLLDEAKQQHQQFLSEGVYKKGITHFSDLSNKDQQELKDYLEGKGKVYDNDESYNNVHINRTFTSIFGEDAFKKTTFNQRKQLLQQVSIDALVNEKFKNDPLLFRIQNLDTETKMELYNNSLFLNYNNAIIEEERGNKKIEQISESYGSWGEDGGPSGGIILEWVRKELENTKTVANIKDEDLGVSALEKRELLLEEYEIKSNENKIRNAKTYIEEATKNYRIGLAQGNTSVEAVEKEFDETFSEILPHYWVFKDDWELKNFTLQDKIEYLSTYKTLAKNDPIAAVQIVNDKMRRYIDNEQGVITHAGYGILNAGIGFVAETVNMVNGLIGIGAALGGADTYAEWMNTGWVNYWNDVSNYNTFNFNKHDLYDQYGGVSSWKGVSSPGEEYDLWNLRTLEETLSMGKYVLSIASVTAVGGWASKAASKVLGLTGNTANNFINTSKVVTQGYSALGMSHSMAKGTFDETYNALLQKVNDRVEYDLNHLAKNPKIQAEVINDWLNSDLINEKLNETLKQAEQEWNKQNRIAKEKGTSLQMSKDQYINSIRKEFLNAAYQDATANVDNLVKNKYSQEIKDNHALYSQDEMLEASARAAMIQASMSWTKEFAAGFLWNKWMIAKNARLNIKPNPMTGLRATETGVEAVKKAMTTSDYLKPIFTRPIKEFGDEWLDVHTEHFSQGFGLQNFNNITSNMYDPYSYLESMNIPYNMWRPTTGFGAGIKSVADGFFDEAGIYEGLIGAVSAFGGSPNIVGTVSLISKENRGELSSNWKNKNYLSAINTFVSNSILSDIEENKSNIMQKKDLANAINETIKKNGHILQDVHMLLDANAKEEKAYAEKDQEAIKNSGVRVAFQLAMTLRDDTLGALPQIQQKVKDLERFANGEITEEDIKLHRKQMQNSTTDAISDEEVIADLKTNSKKLLDVITKTNESFDILNKSKYGKRLSQQTKTQLVFNRVYDSSIESELNILESKINGNNSKYSTEKAPIGVEFSSEEGLAEHKRVQQETIDALEKRKKQIQNRLTKEKRGRSKNRNYYIQSLELDLKAIDRALEVEKETQQSLDNYTIVENIILSEAEILALNPEKRAQMLNPLFKERYNKEQQEVLDNLIKRLRRENPEVLEHIQLAGQLYTNKRLNNEAYDRVLENSDVYDGYVEYMQNSFQHRAAKAGLNIVKRRVKEDLDKVEDSNLMQHLMTKSYSAELLELYRKENVKEGTERERILKEVEDIFKTLKAIGTVISSYEDASIKKPLRDLFQLVISKIPITNSKEFYQQLVQAFEGVEGDLAEKAREILQKVAKLTNQINTTSEEKQIDREQREQDNTTRVTEEQNQHKEAENTQQETKPEVQQPESTEEKPVNTESPTIAEQAQQAEVPVYTVQKDVTEEGNTITTSNNYVSVYSRYNVKALNEDGTLIPQVGAEENDRMNVFYRFLENRDIKLQDIIDFELTKILKKNPDTKVYFAMHSTNNSDFNNYMFAVVEYNDDVRAIHNESSGGTFTTLEGKKYLIIGAVGTEITTGGNSLYTDLNHRLVAQKMQYINSHSENDYFWVSNDYTQIKEIQAGRRVRSIGEAEVKMRSISELLYGEDGNYNEESNPTHLGDPRNKKRGYSSLGWAIQKGEEWIPINTGSKKVIPLSSPSDNNGAVFVLIETADGSLLPIYINPTFYNEIKDGNLKDKINSLLTELLSKDFERRKKAKDELKQFLVLSDDNTFTIGKEGFNSISIKRNGSVFKTFNIDNGINISEFLDAVKQANFRINVTVSTLQTPGLIAEYDEAGALTTDISVLHTRNASFTMYRIDNEGKPIIDDAPSYQSTTKPKEERQIQFGNKRYREENGVFKDELDKIVEDRELIRKLKFAQQVEKMEPSLQERGFNYYVIDDNKENPIVIRVGTSKDVVIANKEQALFIINKVNKIAEAKAKAEAALAQAEEVDSENLEEENDSITHENTSEDDIKIGISNTLQGFTVIDDSVEMPDLRSTAYNSAIIFDNELSKIYFQEHNGISYFIITILGREGDNISYGINRVLSEEQRKDIADIISNNINTGHKHIKSLIKNYLTNIKPDNKKETEEQKDINKAGNISLENLESSNKLITFADIYEDIEQSIQLEDVFAEKGWKFGTQQEVEELLKSKNIPIIGITSFENWLDIIKNCR